MEEIVKRLHEDRRLKNARDILESAGYRVSKKQSSIKESKDSEYQLMKKQYSKIKDFKDKYKESGNLKDFLDELDHSGKKYEIYDNRNDNGCTVFYESEGEGTRMNIRVKSGVNSDGFSIDILSGGKKVFSKDYAYGYDASYDKSFAGKDKPYVSDIINNLCDEYGVDKSNVSVTSGKNVFKGDDVHNDKVEKFKREYLGESTNINEALETGDTLEYEGRPCVVAYIDEDDGEALLKFTDGEEPKKQFVSLSDLETPPAEDSPSEDEVGDEEDTNEDVMSEEEKSRILNAIKNSDDPIQTAFDELVPSSGPAETVAGEIVRATMRLLYRDYNDGDKFYEGYGKETCGSSAQYLIDIFDEDERIFRILLDLSERVPNMSEEKGDEVYTEGLNKVASIVIERILEGNDFIKNTKDSLDTELTDVKDWEPTYNFEADIPYSVLKHIEAGNISTRDLEEELENWDLFRGIEFSIDRYYIEAEVNKDQRDQLDDEFESAMDSYGEELDNDYGDTEEEEDEE